MTTRSETFANAFKTTLAGNGGSITSGATSFSVASLLDAARAQSADTPTPSFFKAILDSGSDTEIIYVLNTSGSTGIASCIRAAETFPGGCAKGSPVGHNDGVDFTIIGTADTWDSQLRPSGLWRPEHFGLLSWPYPLDTLTFGTENDEPSTGNVYVATMPMRVGQVISELVAYVVTAPAMPSDLTHGFLGLYDYAGNPLSASADSPSAFGSVGPVRLSMSGGAQTVASAGGPDTWVKVAMLICSSGTMPVMANNSLDTAGHAQIDFGAGTPILFSEYDSSGTATSLPSSLVRATEASNPTADSFWMAVA